MDIQGLTDAKRRVLDLLKQSGPATAGRVATALGLTNVAVRQHLLALEDAGLVAQRKLPAAGRGRPSMLWSLTNSARRMFPDRHSELAVSLIDAMREAMDEEGLDRVLKARAKAQVAQYRALMPAGRASLESRVEALARQRSAEGYMAEVVSERPGSCLLIERHCPICEAATCCTGLCSTELEVFQTTLGPTVRVERTEHLISGDDRCVYRISRC